MAAYVQCGDCALQELTAIEPGMNRFQWDMRYEPAAEVPGFREPTSDDFRDSVDGPTVVPGTYSVAFRYGDKTISQPLHVKLDPRLHPSAADLDPRLALEARIRNTLDGLNRSITSAMAARSRVGPVQRARLDRELAGLVQLNIHSSEGDLLHETKLRDYLAFLSNQLELAFARPTAAQFSTFDELQGQSVKAESALRAILGEPRN